MKHLREDRKQSEDGITNVLSVAQSTASVGTSAPQAVWTPAAPPVCSLTVDVEDWYQSSVDYDAPITDRVVRNMNALLEMLDEVNVRATFFVQGLVAEAFPRMVAELVREGHEVQSHGHTHRPLHLMNRRTLHAELERARKSVEDASGVRVTAFRAPDFSIRRENLWALEVLAEVGFEVDSSIFPLATKRYGISGWEIVPERIALASGAEIVEAPVAVWAARGMRIPVAGGGYFRLLPQTVLEGALRSIVAEGRPAIVYCHPYEFNPTELDEYRGQVPLRVRLHQGLGRRAFSRRIRHLLVTLPFGRMDEVLNGWWAR